MAYSKLAPSPDRSPTAAPWLRGYIIAGFVGTVRKPAVNAYTGRRNLRRSPGEGRSNQRVIFFDLLAAMTFAISFQLSPPSANVSTGRRRHHRDSSAAHLIHFVRGFPS
jgi:hypothetical protein